MKCRVWFSRDRPAPVDRARKGVPRAWKKSASGCWKKSSPVETVDVRHGTVLTGIGETPSGSGMPDQGPRRDRVPSPSGVRGRESSRSHICRRIPVGARSAPAGDVACGRFRGVACGGFGDDGCGIVGGTHGSTLKARTAVTGPVAVARGASRRGRFRQRFIHG